MIELRVEGLQEVVAYLEKIRKRAASTAFWQVFLRAVVGKGRGYAQAISPVVTGSYRSAHRDQVSGVTATLDIDPAARNTVSNIFVTRYAGNVEENHQVYGRTAVYLEKISEQSLNELSRRLVQP